MWANILNLHHPPKCTCKLSTDTVYLYIQWSFRVHGHSNICYGCITIQVNIAYFYDIYILKYMIAFHYLLHQNRHTSPLTPFWHLQLNCLLFRASTVQPLQTADYHIAVKTKGKWCVNMYNCTSWWTKHVLAGKQINLQQTERPQMARQIVWVCPYYARVWVLLWRKKQEDK